MGTIKRKNTVSSFEELVNDETVSSFDELEKKNPVGNDSKNGVKKSGLEIPSTSNDPLSFAQKLGQRINDAIETGKAKPIGQPAKGDIVFGSRKRSPNTFTAEEKTGLKKIEDFNSALYGGVLEQKNIQEVLSDDAGAALVSNFLNTYSDKEKLPPQEFLLAGEGEHWASAIKNSQSKYRINTVAAIDNYDREFNATIQDLASNARLKTLGKPYASSMGGGVTQSYEMQFPSFDPNNPDTYEGIIKALKSSDVIVDKEGNPIKINKEELSQKLLNQKRGLIAKNGVKPLDKAYADFSEQENEDYFRTKIEDAATSFNMKANIGRNDYSKSDEIDKVTAENVRLGLEDLRTSDKGRYLNVLAALKEKSKIDETTFVNLAHIGQAIRNTKIFKDAATNPDLIGKETDINYADNAYEFKKAKAAAQMGEWLKNNGYTNQSEFSEKEIRKAAKSTGINDEEILQDIIFTEHLLGKDAIPKSGILPSLFDRGLIAPINSISNTIDGIGETQAETYLRSNSLSGGSLGSDKIIYSTGERSDKLESDKNNVLYSAIEGLGQFVTQAALTRGIGGIAGAAGKALVGTNTTRALLTAGEGLGAEIATGTFASTYLQSYGSNYEDALNKSGDVKTAKTVAAINSLAEAAFEEILPDAKLAGNIVEGFKNGGVAKSLFELVKKGGDPKDLLKEGANIFVKFGKEAGNVITQEQLEELGTTFTNFAVEQVYSPKTAENRNLGSEMLDTFKATAIQTAIPAILSGGGAAMRKDFTQKSLHDAALNVNAYEKQFENLRRAGKINQEQENTAISLIKTHRESIINAPKVDAQNNDIPLDKRLEYATEQTSIAINTKKLENKSLGKPQIEDLKNKIVESEKIQSEIYDPTNIKLSQPIEGVDEQGISIGDNVPAPVKIESAVIEIGGKQYEGKNHAEAILAAQADGQDISNVDRQEEGKFKLSDGSIIDRAEAKKQFGQDRSELIIPQDEAANNANKEYAQQLFEKEKTNRKLGVYGSMPSEVAIKEIAKQAQGVTETGEADTPEMTERVYQSTVNQFGKQLTDAAIKAYPIESLLSKGNVPSAINSKGEPENIAKPIEINPEIKVAEPTKEPGANTEQKIKDLELERDAEVIELSKPDIRLEPLFVQERDLANSKDPIQDKKAHNSIKDRYKELKKLINCLHAK